MYLQFWSQSLGRAIISSYLVVSCRNLDLSGGVVSRVSSFLLVSTSLLASQRSRNGSGYNVVTLTIKSGENTLDGLLLILSRLLTLPVEMMPRVKTVTTKGSWWADGFSAWMSGNRHK